MLRSTGVVLLLISNYIASAVVSDLFRIRRDTNDVDNAIIEVFNDCKCVYYYQCDANNYIITNGETLFNVRVKETRPRILCKGRFDSELLCCKLNKTDSASAVDLKSPGEGILVTERNNTNYENIFTTPSKNLSCGAQRPVINVRIFAGEDELTPSPGEFPWIVAIFKKAETYEFHCSGALIHPKVVLTANHCVHRKNPSIFKVILNGQIVLASIGANNDEEKEVSEIVHHAEYYAGGLFNDVALLILKEPYVPSKANAINTICLPPSDIKLNNSRCLVAGWGKGSQNQGKTVMKKVELPFVDFKRCQELLRRTRLGAQFNLHKSFMCAGGEKGKDACKGDGGSPLMCQLPGEGRYFQMGIVSWGVGCGDANVPGIYGNVQEFSGWIRSELESRGLKI